MTANTHFNILVVDDFTEILEYLVVILSESVQYAKISTANDGKEALDLCKKESFNLILTDFKMPYVSGYEFANYIRKQPDNLNISTPIIFISGYIPELKMNGDLGKNLSYLSKPISEDELLKEVCKYLQVEYKTKSAG